MNTQSTILDNDNTATPRIWAASPDRRFRRDQWETGVSILALAGDVALILASFVLAYWVRFESGWFSLDHFNWAKPNLPDYTRLIFFGFMTVLIGLPGKGHYGMDNLLMPRQVLKKLWASISLSVLIFTGLTFTLHTKPPVSRLFVLLSLVFILLAVFAWRLGLSRVLNTPKFRALLGRRMIVLGSVGDAFRIQTGVMGTPDLIYVGWVDVGGHRTTVVKSDRSYLGSIHELGSLLRQHAIDLVVLSQTDGLQREAITSIIKICEDQHVGFRMVPQYFEILISSLRPGNIGGVPVLGLEMLPLDKLSNRFKKRLVDVLGALFGLALSAPVIALFTALVYWESPGPVFYQQSRVGLNGKRFNIIKIRSMRLDAETAGAQWAKENDPRRLRVGAFMRKWNIDETPQFWNVLFGQMSLVGPRPERPELIAKFKNTIPHYNARHMYPPGITGWAQVNGWRGNTSLEERIRHDIWYMEHWSLSLDFWIMFRTFFKQKNAY